MDNFFKKFKKIEMFSQKKCNLPVIQNGEMRLIKVVTKYQLADILTKGLHLPQVTAYAWMGSWAGPRFQALKDLCPQEG